MSCHMQSSRTKLRKEKNRNRHKPHGPTRLIRITALASYDSYPEPPQTPRVFVSLLTKNVIYLREPLLSQIHMISTAL